MPRLPRRILPGRLYEITDRTFQSRSFFVPSRQLNPLIAGALAHAQRKYGVTIHWVTFMTNPTTAT